VIRLQRTFFSIMLVAIAGWFFAAPASAQFQMPDPKQMSGIPRPVDDLPDGSISVRLIRGSLSNNIAGHPVQLVVGGAVRTTKTDENGRAQFDKLPPNALVKASADVDGEHLESQEFHAPGRGGIRLMLVATDKNAAPATSPEAPAIAGDVVVTNQSRIVMEAGDEAMNVFYLIDIENTARVPVNPPRPFNFDLPKEAVGSGLMEGSTPKAVLSGRSVVVSGPFPPGHTMVQVGMSMPSTSGSVDFSLTLPANLQGLAVIAQKVGDAKLSSPQLESQREMPANGLTFIAGTGGPVNAGQPITVSLSGLPHHSGAPRIIALGLAMAIILAGIALRGSTEKVVASQAEKRKKLIARREKLLADLGKLDAERQRSGSPSSESRYAARREELMTALESVYGALDTEDVGPSPDRAGRAA